jgi:hypothetical protein
LAAKEYTLKLSDARQSILNNSNALAVNLAGCQIEDMQGALEDRLNGARELEASFRAAAKKELASLD